MQSEKLAGADTLKQKLKDGEIFFNRLTARVW